VSTTSAASGIGRKPVVLVLAIVGVVVLIIGILWFLGVTPSFLNIGSHVKSGGHHLIRGAVAAVVGIALLVFAFIQNKKA
jgi:fumarate reductase subunit C